MTDKEPKFNFNNNYRIKPEEPKEPTLLERIEEKWGDKEVIMLEWDEHCDDVYMLIMKYKECHWKHIEAQSMKGFYKYVYLTDEDVLACNSTPISEYAEWETVAVLFNK